MCEKTDAVKWWKGLSEADKLKYANDYYTTDDVNSLTIKQIVDLSYYILIEKRD